MAEISTLTVEVDTRSAVKGLADLKTSTDNVEASTKKATAAQETAAAQMKKFDQDVSKFINTQDRLTESISSLANRGLQSLAAAFGVYKIAEYIKDATLLAARYETLGVSMTVLGRNAGYTREQMDQAETQLRLTGITAEESRAQILKLVQANIDLSYSSKLARIAQDAAVIGNMNSSEAFARLIHGIQTGQTEVLRYIGINVSMENSYKKLAETLHVHVDSLSQTQKMQAIVNAVMEEGKKIAGTYEAAMGTAGKQLNSMKRYSEDLKLAIGEVFQESLIVAVEGFTKHLKDSNAEVEQLSKQGQLKQWGEDLKDALVFIADVLNGGVILFKSLVVILGEIFALSTTFVTGIAKIMISVSSGNWAQAARDAEVYRDALKNIAIDGIDQLKKLQDGWGRFADADKARTQAKAQQIEKEKQQKAEALANEQAARQAYDDSFARGEMSIKQYYDSIGAVQAAFNMKTREQLEAERMMREKAENDQKTLSARMLAQANVDLAVFKETQRQKADYIKFSLDAGLITQREYLDAKYQMDIDEIKAEEAQIQKKIAANAKDPHGANVAKAIELEGQLTVVRMKLTGATEEHTRAISGQIELRKIDLQLAKQAADDEERLAEAYLAQKRQTDEVIGSMYKKNKETEFEISLIGKSKNEVEILRIQEATRLAVLKATTPEQAELIKQQGDYAVALAQSRQAAEQWSAGNTQLITGIGDAFGDFVGRFIDGWKSAMDYAKNELKSLAMQLISFFAKKWILEIVASGSGIVGASLSTAAQAALTTQNASPTASLFSALGAGANAASGGFFSGIQAGWTGSPYAGSGALAEAGSMVGQAAQVAAPYLAAIAAVVTTYQQYKKWGNDAIGKTGVLGGAAAGAYAGSFLGPIGTAIGAAIGAVLGGLGFGRGKTNMDAGGIQGTVSGSTFSGQNWQDMSQRGGLFRSDKRWTEVSNMPAEQAAAFQNTLDGFRSVFKIIGGMLGKDADKLLEGFTASFKIEAKDSKPEDVQKAIKDFFDKVFRDQLGLVLEGEAARMQVYIDKFTGTTEELMDFAVALSTVAAIMPKLGIKGLSFDSLDAMTKDGEDVIKTFTRVAQSFGQIQHLFDTPQDALSASLAAITDAFEKIGVKAPIGVAGWNAMVDSIDLSTEAGRALFDTMTGVSGVFKDVQTSVKGMIESIQNDISSIYGGQWGAQFAKGALDAAIDAVNNATGNQATREQTYADLASGVNNQYIIDYINNPNSDPRLIKLVQDMLSAYAKYQQATQSMTTTITNTTPTVNSFANALATAKDNVGKFMRSLVLGDLSPLSPQLKLDEAQRQWQEMLAKAKTGDVDATNGLQGAATTYLKLAQDQLASSPLYVEIFRTVLEGLGSVAPAGAPTWQSLFQTALPVSSPMASQADIRSLEESISALIQVISNGISVNDKEGTDAVKSVKTAVDKLAQKAGALAGS